MKAATRSRLLVSSAIAIFGFLALTYGVPGRNPSAAAASGILDSAAVKFDRLDPAIDKIIPKGAMLERVADGFKWVEGPIWVGDSLYFAEIPSNSIRKWNPASGVS